MIILRQYYYPKKISAFDRSDFLIKTIKLTVLVYLKHSEQSLIWKAFIITSC